MREANGKIISDAQNMIVNFLRSSLVLTASFALAIVITIVCQRPTTSSRNPTGFAVPELDLGSCPPREVITSSVIFNNPSNRSIHIDAVIASCGCIYHDLADKSIPPKSSATFKVGINTDGAAPGNKLRKSLLVRSTGASQEEYNLVLTAHIVPYVDAPQVVAVRVPLVADTTHYGESTFEVLRRTLGVEAFGALEVAGIGHGCLVEEILPDRKDSFRSADRRSFRLKYFGPATHGRVPAIKVSYKDLGGRGVVSFIDITATADIFVTPPQFVVLAPEKIARWTEFVVACDDGGPAEIADVISPSGYQFDWKCEGNVLSLKYVPPKDRVLKQGVEKVNLVVGVNAKGMRRDLSLPVRVVQSRKQ